MDTSLQPHAEHFKVVIKELTADTENRLRDINERIDELNKLLQSKEMFTDRSENASFQIATDERDMKLAIRGKLQKRINTLQTTSEDYTPTGVITKGSTVELLLMSIDGKKPTGQSSFIIKLVEHEIEQANKSLISIKSKVGDALLNRVAGDIIEVLAPAGKVKYRIERCY